MQVQEIRLDQIKVKDRAREDKGDIEGLAIAIKQHGLIQPITLDTDLKLVAGERRYLAHRLLGLDTIKAIVRPINGEANSLEIELIENVARKDLEWHERAKLELKIWNLKIAQYGEWEPTTNPKGWTKEKHALLVGRDKSNTHRALEIAKTMEEAPELALEEMETEDAAWKDVKKLEEKVALKRARDLVPDHIKRAVDYASDHYLIGDAMQEMTQMKGDLFHFAEVDPPYGVDLDKRKSRNTDGSPMDQYFEWDNKGFPVAFRQLCTLVYDRLRPNAFAVFWYGMSWHHMVLTTLRDVGFGVPDIPAVWVKGEMGGQTAAPETTLGSAYEPFFLARKGQPKLPRQGRGNVFNYPALAKKDHPTEKPLVLMEEILNLCLDPGSHILIPFLGSGVTLRAAYRLQHTGIGWDLSDDHKESFLKRITEDKEKEYGRKT